MATMGAESFAAFHSESTVGAAAASDQQQVRSSSSSSSRQSAVAYLFGGMASMAGLIGLAILILACAYWKLSGRFEEEEADHVINGDVELQGPLGQMRLVEEEKKILVIMAGDQKPTFIATPIPTTTATGCCT